MIAVDEEIDQWTMGLNVQMDESSEGVVVEVRCDGLSFGDGRRDARR
jgi:hypothetical protein